ncbi:hypothetical protein N7523_009570 [Penicillium sp. IBT 18751x]|nr:hypothetical protein N7523_009570 [Penicillium sp. IBT 18751x]
MEKEVRRLWLICAISAILLAGCSSAHLSNVYLLSLHYKATSSLAISDPTIVSTSIAHAIQNITQAGKESTLEVRVGYMGLCIMQSDEVTTCSSSATKLANMLKLPSTGVTNSIHGTADPLNLIHIAADFKDKIVFDGLLFIVVAIAVICFIVISTFPWYHAETDESSSDLDVKKPSDGPYHAVIGAATMGFAFGLISALWQHVNSSATASMAETLNYGLVAGDVGPAAMALGWIGVALIGLVAFGLLITLLSIRRLRILMSDE